MIARARVVVRETVRHAAGLAVRSAVAGRDDAAQLGSQSFQSLDTALDLDRPFLAFLQREFAGRSSLCGYGAGTDCLADPRTEWTGTHTYIQRTGINRDLGLFDDPDAFYGEHRQRFGLVRGLLYRHAIRHWMNARVHAIRNGTVPAIPSGIAASAALRSMALERSGTAQGPR